MATHDKNSSNNQQLTTRFVSERRFITQAGSKCSASPAASCPPSGIVLLVFRNLYTAPPAEPSADTASSVMHHAPSMMRIPVFNQVIQPPQGHYPMDMLVFHQPQPSQPDDFNPGVAPRDLHLRSSPGDADAFTDATAPGPCVEPSSTHVQNSTVPRTNFPTSPGPGGILGIGNTGNSSNGSKIAQAPMRDMSKDVR